MPRTPEKKVMFRTRLDVHFRHLGILVSATIFAAAHFQTSSADETLKWNEVFRDVLVANESLQNPGMASRSMAMLNLAIYDSFKMTSASGETYYSYDATPKINASRDATVAKSAYTVLSSIYPDQQSILNTQLQSRLALIPEGDAKVQGKILGQLIGNTIVNKRADDGYNTSVQYNPTDAPGHWQPDPVNPDQEAWGPNWGQVQTFSLPSVDPFLPTPMPALNSAEYATAFNEVKSLGVKENSTRSDEQTQIGYFWAYDRIGMGTPMRLYNSVLETISKDQNNTAEETAALFALASVSVADAGIVSWNSKFKYDFWRPVTGIRAADLDNNPLTMPDPDWEPLGAPGGEGSDFTPPFPTYLSGHATFGGALFEAITDFYGTDNISFTLTSDELPGVERSFTSLSEAMAENGRSRVYLGIHWNFDDTVARVTGADVANFISSRPFVAATAIPEPSAAALIWTTLAVFALIRRRLGYLS